MKICKKCNTKKSTDNFYKHSGMSDGYINECKECVKKRVSEYAKTTAGLEAEKRRQATIKRKRWVVEYTRKKREQNPLKYKARMKLNNAVRSGKAKKTPCEICGANKVQAHHDDYSEPLNVRWLCFNCHRKYHEGI